MFTVAGRVSPEAASEVRGSDAGRFGGNAVCISTRGKSKEAGLGRKRKKSRSQTLSEL